MSKLTCWVTHRRQAGTEQLIIHHNGYQLSAGVDRTLAELPFVRGVGKTQPSTKHPYQLTVLTYCAPLHTTLEANIAIVANLIAEYAVTLATEPITFQNH